MIYLIPIIIPRIYGTSQISQTAVSCICRSVQKAIKNGFSIFRILKTALYSAKIRRAKKHTGWRDFYESDNTH
jgi:hypothetical protein